MIFIDTHAHLYLPEFKTEIDQIIERAQAEEIKNIYLPAIDAESIKDLLDVEASFPLICRAMIGLHPCSVKEGYESELKHIAEWLRKRPFAAVGETGLDFYWDKTFIQQQYLAFENQIELALQYNLPVVIHSRESGRECLEVVKKYQNKNLRGIFHCFSGSHDLAEGIIKTGFYLGIGGVITYKNSGLAEVIKNIPLDHLVLETDAPYLTPVPFRGKRNESSFLKYIAQKLAEIKGVPIEEVAKITTENAQKVFGKEA